MDNIASTSDMHVHGVITLVLTLKYTSECVKRKHVGGAVALSIEYLACTDLTEVLEYREFIFGMRGDL